MQEDSHFSALYEGIYILFKTGIRISEFCGLTISDIDFANHCFKKIIAKHKAPKIEPSVEGVTGFL